MGSNYITIIDPSTSLSISSEISTWHQGGNSTNLNAPKLINNGLIDVQGPLGYSDAIIENNGSLIVRSSGNEFDNDLLFNQNSGGSLVIESGSVFANFSNALFNFNGGTITNNGTIQNSGLFDVVGANLQIAGTGLFQNTSNGILQGNLVVGGDLINQGAISPGNSPGYVVATGNYVEEGTLNIELGGDIGPSTAGGVGQYDYFYAMGNIDIDPTAPYNTILNVSLLSGFTPTAGMVFDILIADGTITGQYSVLNLPSLSPGLHWKLIYGYNGPDLAFGSESLRITAILPEPSTYLILGTMLMFIAMIRKQKKAGLTTMRHF